MSDAGGAQGGRPAEEVPPAAGLMVSPDAKVGIVSTSNRPVWSEYQLVLSEFKYLEGQTSALTLDSCASAGGDNALTPKFCVGIEEFLAQECGGEHVLLHAPRADLTVALKHYADCKARSPAGTSACILVPAFLEHDLPPGLLPRDKRLVKTYYRGSRLFTAVGLDGKRSSIPLKYAVHVYYDPPTPVPSLAVLSDEGRLHMQ